MWSLRMKYKRILEIDPRLTDQFKASPVHCVYVIKIRPVKTGEPNVYAIEGPMEAKKYIDRLVKVYSVG